MEKNRTGFILVSIDRRGCPFVETWSASIDEAKADAAEQFSVSPDAWELVSEGGN